MSKEFVEITSPMGGVMWKGYLAGCDAGYSIIESFINKYFHQGWTLSIYDINSEATIEINCDLQEIPQIASYIYNLEHAAPMIFIGENPLTESYVIGMSCTRGRINIPGIYKAVDGKLFALKSGEKVASE